MTTYKSSSTKFLIGLVIVTLFIFLSILYNILTDGSLLMLDRYVSQEIPHIHSLVLTKLVVFITNINGMLGSVIFSIILLSFLVYKRYFTDLKFYLITFSGAFVLFVSIKLLVERTRPALKIVNELGYSFPSGHSTMSMAIALSIYFIFSSKISSAKGHIFLLISTFLWPILIAFTRLYLNVHWFSDVIAGLTLGFFWVALIRLIFIRNLNTPASPLS